MNKILIKKLEIEKRRKLLEEEEALNQFNCDHPHATWKPRADTGNYDPTHDRFWYDCECPDCGLFWTEDQK